MPQVVWLTRPGDWQVYRALCKTTNETVAIKVLDLERQDPGKLVRTTHANRCQVSERAALSLRSPTRCSRYGVSRRRRPCGICAHALHAARPGAQLR
jgi:hypothetical protein